ncbi:PTS system fructose-specific EIIB'BC component [Candidatus Erwinia haradaeae]|uniref:PTS system fructose-specific EIIB'BC component n=1 Tax=Candidatus Erwinia haradaeae TaxID=1922217 RepID=A0A451CZ81_9GAMM|nr:PTS fructose transporter subunit IIBC [Candidatus Erwinia haradaeae]VFP78734.1 PTS system fructose-specific EIIB'BC component [Candidatus Erwinia haradaeae]
MKTILIIDCSLGLATRHMAKNLTKTAAEQSGILLTDQLEEADRVIVVGQIPSINNQLYSKKIYLVDIAQLLHHPKKILLTAQTDAQVYSISAPQLVSLPQPKIQQKRIIAVTACPTGIAHTFMAAEAINNEAKKRGWWIKVETRGSVGVGNVITDDEVKLADLVIVAADIDIDLSKFSDKLIYRTSTSSALKNTKEELDKAITEAKLYQTINEKITTTKTNQESTGVYRHLLTGVSYMLPLVVAGGLITALSFAVSNTIIHQFSALAPVLMQVGSGAALALMIPVLAGFISFSISDRPGLAPGLIGGVLASSVNAGFLGGIIAGFIAGYTVKFVNLQCRLPKSLESLKPILLLPVISSLVTGLLMIYVVGKPISSIMSILTNGLENLGTANSIVLGAILGGMMCIDMGGPLNKVAYSFGVGFLSSQTYTPMAAIMAAGIVPPFAMGLATLLVRKKFSQNQRELGKAAFILGMCFISEGAIPFAARDPIRVLPCCAIGGAVTGAISMAIGAKLVAPHGGLFVLFIPGAITPVFGYLIAIIIGTLVAGVSYAQLKNPEVTYNTA